MLWTLLRSVPNHTNGKFRWLQDSSSHRYVKVARLTKKKKKKHFRECSFEEFRWVVQKPERVKEHQAAI